MPPSEGQPWQEPVFLGLEELLAIHQHHIDESGGSSGIRDLGLLQSAMAQPQAQFSGQFLHVNIFEMAAAYLFHIVQNHPFVDANKRTGAAAADIFLTMNGVNLQAPAEDFEALVLSIAEGKSSKADAAKFFQQYSKK